MSTNSSSPSIRKPFYVPSSAGTTSSSATRFTRSPRLRRTFQALSLLLVYYNEISKFWQWACVGVEDDEELRSKHQGAKPMQLLVIGDVQLKDRWTNLFQNYRLKKSWSFITSANVADGVIFLGVDDSSALDEHAFLDYVTRFNKLFPIPRVSTASLSAVPAIFVPSRSTLSSLSSAAVALARERFEGKYNPVSDVVRIGGWEIVYVDGLLSQKGGVRKSTKKFVDELKLQDNVPRLLVINVPLLASSASSCGSRRGAVTLDAPTTEWLLSSVKPTLIFSDYDEYCRVAHPYSSSTLISIPETTIPPFSSGFNILSMYPPSLRPDVAPMYSTSYCDVAADPSYSSYFVILFLAILLSRAWASLRFKRSSSSARSNGLPIVQHGHSRSLSRTIFTPRPAFDADEEDDATFPTFPHSPAHEYHSGVDGPAPTATRTGHVRRLSRIWSWKDERRSGIIQRLRSMIWVSLLLGTLGEVARLIFPAVGLWFVLFVYFL